MNDEKAPASGAFSPALSSVSGGLSQPCVPGNETGYMTDTLIH